MITFLSGRAGTGKTTWFENQNPSRRVLHATGLRELRTFIMSTYSQLIEQKPTLINTWFDLDCKGIEDLKDYDLTIELHYEETIDAVKTTGTGRNRRYIGVANLGLFGNVMKFRVTPEIADKWFKDHGITEPHPERYPSYNHLKLHVPAIAEEGDLWIRIIGAKYGLISRNRFLMDAYQTFMRRI